MYNNNMIDNYSKIDSAKEIVGMRSTSGLAVDFPAELGYHCPVCKYTVLENGEYDERLYWSEYNYFIWCSVCNKDYPSMLCIDDIDKSIDVFLSTIKDVKSNV